MKVLRITKDIHPGDAAIYDMLRKWLGDYRVVCTKQTTVWITILGIPVYRLYRYWLVQHHCHLHSLYPRSIFPEYTIPAIKWQWVDKQWIKHFSEVSSKITKSK